MKRFNSLPNCAVGIKMGRKRRLASSLPSIVFSAEESAPRSAGATGLKRHNSRKVKLLQKTWEKVMTIIHPSGRRNSRPKQSPSEVAESPRLHSPSIAKYLKSSQCSSSAPSTPVKKLVFDFEPIPPGLVIPDRKYVHHEDHGCYYQHHLEPGDPEVDQVVKNYVELQKRLSDELHHAMKDEKRKEEVLSEEFKKRLQQWEMWKASTGKFHYTEEELQKLIPLEFSKKMQEWENIKSRPREEVRHFPGDNPVGVGTSSGSQATATTKNERRKKKGSSDESHRLKELAWLEKQLEKIEGEKKRLEREMTKYCEREVRLRKMKEALRVNNQSKQIWIKTPTAECKVEGLNEKFTKKLYKWEEKKGIHPDASTMALLNPKYFMSEPEHHLHNTPEIETNQALLSDPEEETHQSEERMSKEFSSEEASEGDEEEYEEATDSFATKDEPASGASNTDSDCFNLKPGYRRRSSDAISSPLSSARSPSPSCCTSDDDENFMLQTVAENEEEKQVEEKPVLILKAKPIVLEEGAAGDTAGVIVKTQRTIFTPVDNEGSSRDDHKVLILESPSTSLNSPKLVKSISDKLFKGDLQQSKETAKRSPEIYSKNDPEPPRVIGAIRKSSNASSCTTTSATSHFRLPPIPAPLKGQMIKDGSKPILGKIPVWCSPLMARRRFLASQSDPSTEKFSPQTEFSLDKFLESNLIPIPPPRPSRIPVNNSSPGCSRRKYSMNAGPSRDSDGVRLVSLTRSSSFQGRTSSGGSRTGVELQHPVVEGKEGQGQSQVIKRVQLEATTSSSVTKSKSAGSILGNSTTSSASSKGLLFGFASKFVPHESEPKQKKQKPILAPWGKTTTSGNTNRK